jgi:hypothetical protein
VKAPSTTRPRDAFHLPGGSFEGNSRVSIIFFARNALSHALLTLTVRTRRFDDFPPLPSIVDATVGIDAAFHS